MPRRRRLLVLGTVLAAVAVGVGAYLLSRPERRPSPPPESATLRSQDFSTNPGWEGLNNRRLGTCVTTRQDFGWRKAGGRDALGGVITRAARPASFGMPVRAFGFGRAFTATGELTVRGTASDPFPSGSAIIGFFNDASRDWRPPNLLAFQLNADTTEDGGDYSVSLAYGSRNYHTDHVPYGDDEEPVGLRFGRTYRWELSYDPAAEGGAGAATLSIPEAGPPVTLELAPQARRAGATLNRFGIVNQTMARGEALELDLTSLSVDGRAVGPGDGWQGRGNRTSYQDCLTGQPHSFGWTGDQDQRVGGVIARTDEDSPELRAYYADRVGRLSLEDRLHMEGTVVLDRANSDSATLVGWFRAGSHGEGEAASAPADFIGVAITGPSAIGQYMSPLVADGRGTVELAEEQAGIVLNPGPGRHRFSFDYYPESGKAGVLVVRLDGQRRAWSLTPKIRRAGARFNRFGLRNMEKGGSFQFVYVDDLRYTFGARGPGAGADAERRERGDPRGGDDEPKRDRSRKRDRDDGGDRDGNRERRRRDRED